MLFFRPKLIDIAIEKTFYINGINIFDFCIKENFLKKRAVKATFNFEGVYEKKKNFIGSF
jgi:hypothetical protein